MAKSEGAQNIRPYTMEIAQFVCNLKYQDIPLEVIQIIKRNTLDTFGCGLFGSTMPWGKIISEFVAELGDGGKASVWGKKAKAFSPNAVLANGTMVHGFELDDVHHGGRVHPGAACATSALALVEERNPVNGEEFITALVAGYEVVTRVAKVIAGSHSERGFHPQGTCGTFGAAASAGKILRLNVEKMANAFGLAGAQSAGLHAAQFGPMAKRFHAGRAAQSGVYAALLAEKGFTGAVDILEKPYGGFCSAFADEFNLEILVEKLGEVYETVKTGLKYHCGCGANHAVLDLIGSFISSQNIKSDEIEKIIIKTDKGALLHVGWEYIPSEVTTAQMNLSYNVAALLLEGCCFVDQFRPDLLRDPRILNIIKNKIQIIYEPSFDKFKRQERIMDIEIEYQGTKKWKGTAVIENFKGSVSNSLSVEETEKKFRILAAKVIGEKKASLLIEKINSLEKLPEVKILGQFLIPGNVPEEASAR